MYALFLKVLIFRVNNLDIQEIFSLLKKNPAYIEQSFSPLVFYHWKGLHFTTFSLIGSLLC